RRFFDDDRANRELGEPAVGESVDVLNDRAAVVDAGEVGVVRDVVGLPAVVALEVLAERQKGASVAAAVVGSPAARAAARALRAGEEQRKDGREKPAEV